MSLGIRITNLDTGFVLVAGSRQEHVTEHDLVPERQVQDVQRVRGVYAAQFVRGNHANVLSVTLRRVYTDWQNADRDRLRLAELVRTSAYDGDIRLDWPDGEAGILRSAVLRSAPKVRKVGADLVIGLTWRGGEWTGPGGTLADGALPGSETAGFLVLDGGGYLLEDFDAGRLQLANN